MAASIYTNGLNAVVTAVSGLVTHVAISTDSTAFAVGQTVMNPSGSGTVRVEAATTTVVDAVTVDKTITITGTDEFTDLTINSIGFLKGTAATGGGTDTLGRIVRGAGLGIGVQSGDVFVVGCRLSITDQS
jgi:hypothetical protein